MIAAWALSLWASAAGAGPIDCSKVEPARSPDPAAAQAYLEVGDAESRQGRPDTAAVAFREAVRLDPASPAARARLLNLCRESGEAADEDFDRATRAVEEGRYEEAIAALGPRFAGEGRPDAAAALLYGISLYERGDDARAKQALQLAAQSPGTADAASVFLGLLALRAGSSDQAAALFDRAGGGAQGELARTARDLAALARRDVRLAVSAEVEGGYDSNVDQAPDRTPVAGLSGDLLYGATASALLRPFGETGPYAVAGARLRNLREIGDYDLAWAGGAAGYRFTHGRDELRVEYAFDAIWLGYQPFSTAHQLQLDGALDLPFARAGALVSARAERYSAPQIQKYSGPTFDGEVSLAWGGSATELKLRYRGQGHRSEEAEVRWLDHGPGVRAMAALLWGRLVVDAQVTIRTYGAEDPGFGDVVRQDAYLDGVVSLEQDLGKQLTVSLCVGGRKAFSNVGTLEYTRLYGGLGLIFTAGLW
ncbi:MAG TPA: tetratricopeptide repeat protein [Myxococcaceae bacterium]|nr:tetratricopeptide repeat protein [Myxococcaceae bacterium]